MTPDPMTPPEVVPLFNPKTDLHLARAFPVDAARVWRCLTEPDLLRQWFAPAPWTIPELEIDPTPGGIFRMVMRSPEGQDMPMPAGCILWAQPAVRLTWTSALGQGFVPAPPPEEGAFQFTADMRLTSMAEGTRYDVVVRHGDAAGCQAHADMGFAQGWGTTADQLGALAATL